ncbi:MAG: BlaI/MecI/CopY family transcriptional regulator [Desulfobacterales bacterium]|nr:BlaI/MecI/CopY family transcriptional regulator [Desulfobacterales bacterium]
MARRASTHPTELELEILKILWRDGPATVRQVREALAPTRKLAHTSVITMLNIMTDKEYLARTTEGGMHTYRAKVGAQAVRRRMLSDLVRRAFDGSASGLVASLLGGRMVSQRELDDVRRLIDQYEKETKP